MILSASTCRRQRPYLMNLLHVMCTIKTQRFKHLTCNQTAINIPSFSILQGIPLVARKICLKTPRHGEEDIVLSLCNIICLISWPLLLACWFYFEESKLCFLVKVFLYSLNKPPLLG